MVPVFEYNCECGYVFDELVMPGGKAKEMACPVCGSKKIRKKFSTFSTFSGCGLPCSACRQCRIVKEKIWGK